MRPSHFDTFRKSRGGRSSQPGGDAVRPGRLARSDRYGNYLERKIRMVVKTPATRAAARTRRMTEVLTPGPLPPVLAAASMLPSTGTGPLCDGGAGAGALGSAP